MIKPKHFKPKSKSANAGDANSDDEAPELPLKGTILFYMLKLNENVDLELKPLKALR